MRNRRTFFEVLEARTVMAPLGAFPDDTGEYMLGDVLVTVVLMESDPAISGHDLNTEDWTPATIADVQSKVQQGMDWWKQTLINSTNFYYNPELPLLNFKYDWTWALDPVETRYEPINRPSSQHSLWVEDFLDRPDVDFLNDSTDIYKAVKAFNNFQREKNQTDWAFTIFVVNSGNDEDDYFPQNGSDYRGAFAFLGGQFLVVPSERPATTFAHETGHIFYALDEYTGGHSYYENAGYYNTQNLNGAYGNPVANFVPSQQQPSIMASGGGQNAAWMNNTTSTSSMAMIGWQDTDGDGVMDVLDVPFTLTGTGTYNASSNQFKFKGTSSVRTLENKNTFGGDHANLLYNDISINKIRRAEYSLDGGAWTTITEFANTPTTANLDLTISGITAGPHTIKIRTFDQRTGASSEEYVATIKPEGQYTPPQYSSQSDTISGYAFRDDNGNGVWDNGEFPLADWGVELQTIDNTLLTMARIIEPSDYAENTVLNSIEPGITLSLIGTTAGNGEVLARTSTKGAGRIFFVDSYQTFMTKRVGSTGFIQRELKAEFSAPVTSVSLKAISAADTGGSSVGRLDAYDANNNLIGRYTTRALAPGQSELMTITHNIADIKYVIAHSHLETQVMFDTLTVGPQTATTTNYDGGFNLSALPPGTYNLKVIAAPNYTPVTPQDGRAQVTVSANGAGSNNLYFAFQFGGNPWHNLLNPLNANGIGGITAFDALIVINYLNLHPNIVPLVAGEAVPGQYLDVNNDNRVTAFDALQIINYLNVYGADIGGEPTGGGVPETIREHQVPPPYVTDYHNSGNTGGGGGGESSGAPQNAAEYFATNPLHNSQRFKDESHTHNHADHDHDEVGFADHNDFGEIHFTAISGSPTDGHHDSFFLLFGRLNQNDDALDSDDVASNTVLTSRLTDGPLSSGIAALIERLRRLKQSAARDEDQSNTRLATIRTELGDDLDALSANPAQLARLRELMQQNHR